MQHSEIATNEDSGRDSLAPESESPRQTQASISRPEPVTPRSALAAPRVEFVAPRAESAARRSELSEERRQQGWIEAALPGGATYLRLPPAEHSEVKTFWQRLLGITCT